MNTEIAALSGRRSAAAPLLAVTAGVAIAHAGPGITALRSVRTALFPLLSGQGMRDHVALTFDDGPWPGNTERVLKALKARGRVVIHIDKRLPVQGGLGAASSNGVATLLALERALKQRLDPEQRLAVAAAVGSDLPLFLIGGTVLGVGRGEEVFPLPDLPAFDAELGGAPPMRAQ